MKQILEWLRTIFIAVIIAVVFRSIAFEPFSIPSGSMIPTLLVGDYLFVSKYSYGYSRYSFPFGVVPIPGRVLGGAPERGDVIVFRRPGDESVDYIKRLVGLPGDTVEVRDGVLHINGAAVERDQIGIYEITRGALSRQFTLYDETLPGGRRHVIQEMNDSENTRVWQVPEEHYFFMGDNRDNSSDSRAGIGFVPVANLIGRAEMIFFSHNGEARFWEIWKWPRAIRFDRIGDSID